MKNVNTKMLLNDGDCGYLQGLKANAKVWKKFFEQFDDDDVVQFEGDEDFDMIIVNGKCIFSV